MLCKHRGPGAGGAPLLVSQGRGGVGCRKPALPSGRRPLHPAGWRQHPGLVELADWQCQARPLRTHLQGWHSRSPSTSRGAHMVVAPWGGLRRQPGEIRGMAMALVVARPPAVDARRGGGGEGEKGGVPLRFPRLSKATARSRRSIRHMLGWGSGSQGELPACSCGLEGLQGGARPGEARGAGGIGTGSLVPTPGGSSPEGAVPYWYTA